MKKFSELLKNYQPSSKTNVAVVSANDESTLDSVFDERIKDFIKPILIGNPDFIQTYLERHQYQAQIIKADTDEEAAFKGIELVRNHEAALLVKGHIQTGTFLKAVVNSETGIVQSPLLTHVVVTEVPAYHKLLITTDGGMVPTPNYEEKKIIIKHAVQVANKIGIKAAKVGILAAAENVNPKIPSSLEAEKLMNDLSENNELKAKYDGPISLDLALSPEIVKLKHYQSPVAGDCDIVVSPDMTAGNILGKSLTLFAKAKMAGLVIGAKAPIVMNSRGSSDDEKMYAILLALYSGKES